MQCSGNATAQNLRSDLAWPACVIARSMEEHRTRVLVVDDDPDTAQSIGRKLTYVGYDVEIATDPRSIVERLHTERADWDVVLLDVALPGMSGIEVLKRFRD